MNNLCRTGRPQICIICNSLSINGGNNHVLHLLRLFREHCSFSICALSEGPMRSVFESIGGETTIFSASSPPDFSRFELVIGNTLLTSHVLRVVHQQGVPYALILHENWPPENFQIYLDAFEFSERISVECLRAAFVNAQHIIFPARALFQVYASLLPSTTVISYINNICPLRDIEFYKRHTSRKEARRQLGILGKCIVFLQLGTVGPRKNQLTTLKAFVKLRKKNPEIDSFLVIKGCRRLRKDEIEYICEIEAFIAHEGLEGCVKLLDVELDEPYPFLRAADVMVLPSRNELLPQALMEAGAFSIPAISSTLDGIREIIEHGVNGFLADPDDVESIANYMYELACNAKLRKKMGQIFYNQVLKTRSEESLTKGYAPLLCP